MHNPENYNESLLLLPRNDHIFNNILYKYKNIVVFLSIFYENYSRNVYYIYIFIVYIYFFFPSIIVTNYCHLAEISVDFASFIFATSLHSLSFMENDFLLLKPTKNIIWIRKDLQILRHLISFFLDYLYKSSFSFLLHYLADKKKRKKEYQLKIQKQNARNSER